MAVNVAADADVVSITTTTAAAMAHNLNPFHMNECSRKQMNSIRSHTHTHTVSTEKVAAKITKHNKYTNKDDQMRKKKSTRNERRKGKQNTNERATDRPSNTEQHQRDMAAKCALSHIHSSVKKAK